MGATKTWGLVVAAGCLAAALVAGAVMIFYPPPPASTARQTAPAERAVLLKADRGQEPPAAEPAMEPLREQRPAPEVAVAPVVDVPPPPPPPKADVPPAAKPPPAAPPGMPRSPKPPLQNPEAREALSLVGYNLAAEAVWQQAINDPSLPAEERKDLIEDLNEDGFADPHNVTPDELPLILSRLELIEELMPQAMDTTNEEAFREAYKDLVNMYRRVVGF